MLDSLLYLCLLVLCISEVDSSIFMTQEYDSGQFKLTCTQSDNYNSNDMYWYRGNNHVLTTRFSGHSTLSKFGNDLSSRTTIIVQQRKHQITIKDQGRDRDSYWACCRYYYRLYQRYYECSKWIFVKSNPTSDIGDNTMSHPSTPTTPPEILMPPIGNENGTAIYNGADLVSTTTTRLSRTTSVTISKSTTHNYTSTGQGAGEDKDTNVSLIVAGSVVGVIILLIVIIAFVCIMRRVSGVSNKAEANPDAHVYSSVTPDPRTDSLYTALNPGTSVPQPLYENSGTPNQAIASDVNVYYNAVSDEVIS